jgi:hypothetical protein
MVSSSGVRKMTVLIDLVMAKSVISLCIEVISCFDSLYRDLHYELFFAMD